MLLLSPGHRVLDAQGVVVIVEFLRALGSQSGVSVW